jgi:hypothetical protein
MKRSRYRAILWVLAALLLVGLFSCASGRDDRPAKPAAASPDSAVAVQAVGGWKLDRPMRLLLAGSTAHDSVKIASELYVDQAIRRVLDSIPQAEFLTLNYRDSLASEAIKKGEAGIGLDDLAKQLRLDGAIYTKIARFGSMLGVDLQIVDPRTKKPFFKDISFSLIRYRDSSGTMLIGPALYDAIRKSLGKYFGVPHTAAAPIATEPLVIGSVEIANTPVLRQIAVQRETLSHATVKALAEYGILHFPEIVPFDIDSRARLYQMFGIGAVEDFEPMHALERTALFNVGVDHYMVGRVIPDRDSLRLRLEIHAIIDAHRDTLIDASELSYGINDFEKSTIDEDFVVAFIDVAEPLYKREAERVRQSYGARGRQ